MGIVAVAVFSCNANFDEDEEDVADGTLTESDNTDEDVKVVLAVIDDDLCAVVVVVVSSNKIDGNKCESSYRTNRNMGITMVTTTNVPNSMDTNSRRGGGC